MVANIFKPENLVEEAAKAAQELRRLVLSL
jgi:hypothetical protein